MEDKVKYSRIRTAGFMAAMAVFCVLIYIIFINYGSKMNDRFAGMEKANMNVYGEEQSLKIREELNGLTLRLEAAARFAGESSFELESEEFRNYLVMLNGDSGYPVEYVSVEAWERRLKAEGLGTEELGFIKELLNGHPAVSEIGFSVRMNGYFFSIGQPVTRDGVTVGTLRCAVNVEKLMERLEAYASLRGTMKSCIADREGRILYCKDELDWIGKSISDILFEEQNSDKGIETFIHAVQQNKGITLTVDVKGDDVFLTNIPMGGKDWNLMSFSSADTTKNISEALLDDTITMGMSLVCLTFLAGVLIYLTMAEDHKKVELEQERYAALSNFSDTVLFEYNGRTDVLQFTQNATGLLGITKHRIENFSRKESGLIHPDDVEKALAILDLVKREQKPGEMEVRLLGRNGGWLWCESRLQPLIGSYHIVIGKISDISERKTKEINLLSLSSTDALTGLMNRDAFRDRVEALLNQQQGFFFMIDVDNFKMVNDTKGHDAGDSFLMKIGQVLRRSFRDYDPVARIGGDEFAAFMSDTSDCQNAEKKAELILLKMAAAMKDETMEVSVSIGIASCPSGGLSYHELYRSADQAMYLAKKRGKNCFCRCQDAVNQAEQSAEIQN